MRFITLDDSGHDAGVIESQEDIDQFYDILAETARNLKGHYYAICSYRPGDTIVLSMYNRLLEELERIEKELKTGVPIFYTPENDFSPKELDIFVYSDGNRKAPKLKKKPASEYLARFVRVLRKGLVETSEIREQ